VDDRPITFARLHVSQLRFIVLYADDILIGLYAPKLQELKKNYSQHYFVNYEHGTVVCCRLTLEFEVRVTLR